MKKHILFIPLLLCSIFLNAQNITLDNSFGTSGFARLNETIVSSNGQSALQSDGKIIILGNKNDNIIISRLNTNGTLDTTFGVNGYCTISNFNYQDLYALSVIENNIFVFVPYEKALLKVSSNGTIDNSFGTNGIMFYSTSEPYCPRYVIDGNYLFVVKTDGVLDKINLLNGNIISSTPTNIANTKGIYRAPNNKLLLQSNQLSSGGNDMYDVNLTLLNYTGNIDNTFGTNGTIYLKTVNSNHFYDTLLNEGVVTDDSDNIFYASNTDPYDVFMLKKFSSNGVLDTTFATNGTYQDSGLVFMNYGEFTGLQFSSNKIYIYGSHFLSLPNFNNDINMVVRRLNSDGTNDTSFNSTGKYIYNTNSYEEILSNFHLISPTSFLASGYTFNVVDQAQVDENQFFIGKFDITESTLSVNNSENQNVFYIENPVQSKLNFITKQPVSSIEIYTTDGKLVKTITKNNSEINIIKGVYISKINFANGKTINKKLIKN